jgi:ribonuclease T1
MALQPRARWLRFVLAAVLLLAALPSYAADARDLRSFAARVGLQNVDAFVETVTTLRRDRRLPASYVSKSDAERLGWRPGADLCRVAPGRAIGGDNFGNRERQLPEAAGRRWREADLDYPCGARGAKRLVWSSDGLIFVTVDHYATFVPVPEVR